MLESGGVRLTVVTAGGGMRALEKDGFQVLDGYDADEPAPGGAGQPLIPWPNRLEDGRYEFGGGWHQVPLTEPGLRNALHGFARWMTWTVEEHGPAHARLGLLMYPRSGYPYTLYTSLEYSVDASGVQVVITARNEGRGALPFACGFHPYFRAGAERVDDMVLEVPAETRLVADRRKIPAGRKPVARTRYDFRRMRAIGGLKLDVAYTDLHRDAEGRARVRLKARDVGHGVAVWMDRNHPYVMVFTGDTLVGERRRRAVAIEPMTAAPNAFRSGDGLQVLEPGAELRCEWGIEVEPG